MNNEKEKSMNLLIGEKNSQVYPKNNDVPTRKAFYMYY